jgi:protein O-GlcNAc transferase
VFSGGHSNSPLRQCLTYINSNATIIFLNDLLEPVKQMLWDKVQKANEKSHTAIRLTDLGKSEEAENLYWESLKLHPTPEAYVNLSKLLIHQERYEEAETTCRRAIKTTRAIISDGTFYLDEFDVFSIAYSNLGIALHSQGKLEEAENCYRFATKINPNYAEAYSNLANLLLVQNRQNEAEDTYRY